MFPYPRPKLELLSAAASVTSEEHRFLEAWEGIFPQAKWGGLLNAWLNALRVYGTSLSILDGIHYEASTFSLRGETYPCIINLSGERILKQRRQFIREQIKYSPVLSSKSYSFTLNEDCPLCLNIACAADMKNISPHAPTNIVADLGRYVILPNRYPSQPGGMLFLRKDHDDHSTRINPKKNGEVLEFSLSSLLTRARIISALDFKVLFDVCDALDLGAMRNHVLDGMSVPQHDHWHLVPSDLPLFSLRRCEKGARPSELQIDELPDTPFSVLRIRGSSDEVAKASAKIAESLERDNVAFTLGYLDGVLYISPRSRKLNTPILVGPGVPFHGFFGTKENAGVTETILWNVPMRGEFSWEQYIPSLIKH